jgi:hypothetical protein
MPDMNIEEIAIALSNYRKSLYTSWDQVDKSSIDKVVTDIFNDGKRRTDPIISRSKPSDNEIKTPARLIDPITTGGFLSSIVEINSVQTRIISQPQLNSNIIFQKTIYFASIYGINQLLNAWIDNTKVVNGYVLNSLTGDQTKVDTITFSTSNNGNFNWCVGDSTVNVICGALVNVAQNMDILSFDSVITDETMFNTLTKTETTFANDITRNKYPDCKSRWNRIYGITKLILFHPNFTQLIPKTIKTILMIISYLKSCGDEYQRLTCEFVNYIIDLTHSNEEYLLEYIPEGSILPTVDERVDLNLVLKGTVYLLSKDRILIGESVEKNTPVYTFLQSPNEAFYDDMELANNFYEGAFGIKGPTINRKNTGILSNRRKELSSPVERNFPDEMEKNIINIIKLRQELLLKGMNRILTPEEEATIRTEYSLPTQFDPANIEPAKEKITQQNDKIESLTKIALSMSYYTLGIERVTPTKYTEFIDTEIFKAVSLTINSDLLEDIKLKNRCRVPRTVSALNSLIHNMYDDPDTVDKLIESYERANNLFLQKMAMYKAILESMRQDIIAIGIDPEIIIAEYVLYIQYISTNKDKLSDEIMKIVDSYLQAEIIKSQRGSRGSRVSYSDVGEDQQRLDVLMSQILEVTTERRGQEEEQTRLQRAQEEQAATAAQQTTSKTAIKKIFGFFKKRFNEITKSITKTGETIQKLTKSKQDLETRISSKTKVYGLETYRKLVNKLKVRIQVSPTSSGGNGKTIKNKTKKNKRKMYITKRRRINNKKSVRKNSIRKNSRNKIKHNTKRHY